MFHPYGSRVPDWFPLGTRIMTLENGTQLYLDGRKNRLNGWRDYTLTAHLPEGASRRIAEWKATPTHPIGSAQTEYLAPSVQAWLRACVDRDAEQGS